MATVKKAIRLVFFGYDDSKYTKIINNFNENCSDAQIKKFAQALIEVVDKAISVTVSKVETTTNSWNVENDDW